eukprot:gnl/MRDRNA2_/MRDRNA2_78540_c0_seq1.p1 gnl/MRDRNA2_/MRDRNA2_78540_c0~~gnl/MRDRNA2_/MRDRNA2_78540_c0_seq1.p1  ORF type:complete len:541 (-),score=64.83 gnl/MRDRNA2_/MRDRNA2_78540_c0_seq1:596-2161(-)
MASLCGHAIAILWEIYSLTTNIFIPVDRSMIWQTKPIAVSLYLQMLRLFVILSSFLLLVIWRRTQKDFLVVEMLSTIASVVMILTVNFSNYYRVAGFFGENPYSVWQRDHFSDTQLHLVLAAITTGVHSFVPIRSCVSWLVPVCGISSFICSTAIGGTPEQRPGRQVVMLALVSFCSWYGSRRNEVWSRKQWGMLYQSRDTVNEQGKELSSLEDRIQGMTALMNVQCQAVFAAGAQLQVVGNNERLEELLGPMQGRELEDMLSNTGNSRERYKMIVAPLLDACNQEENARVVLVPPVTFQTATDTFDAEVIVADTGSWHGSGQEKWRYLVGLKKNEYGVECSSLPTDLADVFNLDNSIPQMANLITSDAGHATRKGIFPDWAQQMPMEEQKVALLALMSRLPCDRQSCCLWHSSMFQLMSGLRELDGERSGQCLSLWFPSFAWQCEACFSLHDDVDAGAGRSDELTQCEVCGRFSEDPNLRLKLIMGTPAQGSLTGDDLASQAAHSRPIGSVITNCNSLSL